MLAFLLTEWDWTEVAEGIVVGTIFLLAPLAWHQRHLHNRREVEHERRHAEIKDALK